MDPTRHPNPTRRPAALLASAVLACLASACASMRPAAAPVSAPALAPDSFTLGGAAVSIFNPAGAVRVEPGSGPGVHVNVIRYGADASRLRAVQGQESSGGTLRFTVDGPASRRLRYPGMPGRSDSVEFRSTRSGFVAGRGGLLGLFGGRSMKVVRVAGKAPSTDAHADLVISVPAGRRVEVRVGIGEIRVAGSTGDLSVQSLTGAIELASAGGRIHVVSGSGGVFVRDGTGELTVTGRSSSLDVTGFTGSRLEATTGAGSIRGASVSAAVVRLHTGAGAVEIAGLRGGSADLQASAGRVAGRDVVVDTLLATSGVGDVALQGLRAGIATVRSRKGDISLDLLTVPALLRADADGGARVNIPSGAGAELAARSDHGYVHLVRDPASSAPTTAAGRSLTLRLGGGGGRIQIAAEHDIVIGIGAQAGDAALR